MTLSVVGIITAFDAGYERRENIYIKYCHALAVVFLVENALFIAVLMLPKLIP